MNSDERKHAVTRLFQFGMVTMVTTSLAVAGYALRSIVALEKVAAAHTEQLISLRREVDRDAAKFEQIQRDLTIIRESVVRLEARRGEVR